MILTLKRPRQKDCFAWVAVVAHNFNHSTWEAGTGGFLSLVYRVSSRTGLHRETLSQEEKKKKKRKIYLVWLYWKEGSSDTPSLSIFGILV